MCTVLLILRLHRKAVRSIGCSLLLLVTTVSLEKTDELIVMPFGV